jgi:hypothetical protein
MATTTTNFGFDIPTSTDLVKNGATQIALLGQDIDTFLNRPITYNGVINAAMQVAQRGTSFTVGGTGVNTLDRWKAVIFSGSSTVSQQLTSDTTNLPNIQYCQRVVRAAGVTSTNIDFLAQSFENLSSTQYAGKTVSFSFYARKGSGFTGTFGANVVSGTGTNQNFIDVAITGQATVVAQTVTLTTTWQRFTYTGTVGATAAQVFVYFTHAGTGTAPANDYFEVTGVQLEIGSQASPFQTASGGSIQGELAMCQRYYFRTSGSGLYHSLCNGFITGLRSAKGLLQFPVTMRVTPTVFLNGSLYVENSAGTAGNTSTVTYANASNNTVVVSLTSLISTDFTINTPCIIYTNNSASSFIAAEAEL